MMKSLLAAVGIGVCVLVPVEGVSAAAPRSSVPAALQLGKPMHRAHLTRKQALKDVGQVMPLQGHTYEVQFGSWRYQGASHDGVRSGQKVDVWEVRINNVTTYGTCPPPAKKKKASCVHRVWHHYAVIVNDRTGHVLQTEIY